MRNKGYEPDLRNRVDKVQLSKHYMDAGPKTLPDVNIQGSIFQKHYCNCTKILKTLREGGGGSEGVDGSLFNLYYVAFFLCVLLVHQHTNIGRYRPIQATQSEYF